MLFLDELIVCYVGCQEWMRRSRVTVFGNLSKSCPEFVLAVFAWDVTTVARHLSSIVHWHLTINITDYNIIQVSNFTIHFLFLLHLVPRLNPLVKPGVENIVTIFHHLLLPDRSLEFSRQFYDSIEYKSTHLLDDCFDQPLREYGHATVHFAVASEHKLVLWSVAYFANEILEVHDYHFICFLWVGLHVEFFHEFLVFSYSLSVYDNCAVVIDPVHAQSIKVGVSLGEKRHFKL